MAMEEKDTFSLEEALAEIRGIVDKMQQGVSDFDQQVALFEQGTLLIKSCRSYLTESELQIEQLIAGDQKTEG